MSPSLYSANLSKGTLKLPESRVICGLLLEGMTPEQWRNAIVAENVLQKKSPASALTTAAYLKQRFDLSHPDVWRLVCDGSSSVATHAALAATIKHSHLVGDFLDIVVREDLRQFKTALSRSEWDEFIEQCAMRDPNVATWTVPVLAKLRQNVFHILAEGGFLTDTKTLRLQRVTIAHQVIECLQRHEEHYVLRCLSVGS